jgi:peptidyl-prolyl cis-trans isomerase C
MFLNQKSAIVAMALSLAIIPGLKAADTTNPAAAKPEAKPKDLFENQVVAKGKGVEVKRSRLDEEMVAIRGSAEARGQMIPPEQMVVLEQQILDRIIQIQLLSSKATAEDKTKAKENCDKRFETIKTRAGTDEVLDRQLKSVGMTREVLKTKMLEESVAEAVIERELKINITDDQVKKFYDENPAKFEQAEMVRASHILLMTKDQTTGEDLPADKKEAKKKQAEDLLKRARGGEDFAKLAKEFSEDPGSKDKGGEYTFPRGQMVPEFEASAFSLKTNEVSDIVTTQFGYHIIKLSEKMPAKKVELAKASSDIKDYLKQQAAQKEMPAYMERIKKEAGVQILDEKLKPKANDLDIPPAVEPATPAPKPEDKK